MGDSLEESPRACVTPLTGTGASRKPVVLPLMNAAVVASRPQAGEVCPALGCKSSERGQLGHLRLVLLFRTVRASVLWSSPCRSIASTAFVPHGQHQSGFNAFGRGSRSHSRRGLRTVMQ